MSGELGNTAQSDLLKLLFQNANWANLGDATGLRGSTTAGSLYVSLHTANPAASGSQTTSEAAYTSYTREGVARSSGGWTISGSSPTQAVNASAITFPQCTGGSETETYFEVGRDSSGAGEAIFIGPLTSSLAVSNNIIPQFAASALVCTLD